MILQNDILRILYDWNPWEKDFETGHSRSHYIEKLEDLIQSGQIVVITGPRRAGKTYIMRQFSMHLIRNGVPRNNIFFLNLEDPRLGALDANVLDQIFRVYIENLSPYGKPFVFLDEIQEVKNWEKWVLTYHELGKARFVVSGSNARLLSKEFGTLLTGRHLELKVFPLSFKEFLDFKNAQDKPHVFIKEYMEFGGFPEVVLSKNKNEIVLQYFADVVEKDIMRRYRVRKTEALKALVRFYMSNISSLTTFSSMEKFTGLRRDTVEKFSSYLESSFLLFFVKRFSFKVKEQEKSPRKVYSYDVAFPNVIGFRFSENVGRIAENIVAVELLRRGKEFYYWKDERHREVDFVVKEKTRVKELIQVSWDISNLETLEREIKALILASKKLNGENLLIINAEVEKEENVKGKSIKYIPLWKWLLGIAQDN